MHAASPLPQPQPIPAEMLLLAYRSGIFPMADSRDDPEIFWVEPRERAIIPLDGFILSRSLAKIVRQDRFTVTCNQAFSDVIRQCAAPRPGHPESWISERILASYASLHDAGHAHSVECWKDGALVGGLYGVGFDRVFCGESMFSRADNASKVALAWLVAMLRHAGFALLDCQFMTDHLASLGAVEIPQPHYLDLVAAAQGMPAMTLPQAYAGLVAGASSASASSPSASSDPASSPGKLIAQSLTQTS